MPICTRKDVSSISVLTRNGNGSYGTEERQRYNGTSQRNGRTELQNCNGRTATEWWKLGIRYRAEGGLRGPEGRRLHGAAKMLTPALLNDTEIYYNYNYNYNEGI